MSNNRRTRTIEIDVADAAMICHALMIAANTALMCNQHDARKRLKAYKDTLNKLLPDIADVFEGEVWSEIAMALDSHKTFKVFFVRPNWRQYGDGYVAVAVGDRTWTSRKSEYPSEDPVFQRVYDYLMELAPLDSVGEKDFKGKPAWE